MRHRLFTLLLLAGFLYAQSAQAATYTIDVDHSAVTFKIRHLVSKVQGAFNQFEGTFDYEPGKPELWKADAAIQAASIDTNVAARDKHLRSADFFDVEKYPTITFKSTKVEDVTESSAKLHGVLTMHGVEQPVVMDLDILGEGKDPWGSIRTGFSATTKVNRKDFGITWNKVLEAGGGLLGDEVEITIEVEAQPMES